MSKPLIRPDSQRRRLLRFTLLAAGLGASALTLPAVSQARTDLSIRIGPPPPPRFERVPPPRRSHVWSPGHWELQRGRYVWIGGVWLRARPGYVYQAPAWQQRDGRWSYRSGHWDRDRDGVPNRYDRRPADPRRG
ncbi:MAG: hypothetical protein AB7G13_06165 [Lautropia sp.]